MFKKGMLISGSLAITMLIGNTSSAELPKRTGFFDFVQFPMTETRREDAGIVSIHGACQGAVQRRHAYM